MIGRARRHSSRFGLAGSADGATADRRNCRRCPTGFTLIELLIVVAIIAILAAIAVPNFLEAQTRSKVSRVWADMRSIRTALEAYRTDNNTYPIVRGHLEMGVQHNRGGILHVYDLTTPVAYMTTADFLDPFAPKGAEVTDSGYLAGPGDRATLAYININLCREQSKLPRIDAPHWLLISQGPDRVKGPNAKTGAAWAFGSYCRPIQNQRYVAWRYDATNGTRSMGDILMWQ